MGGVEQEARGRAREVRDMMRIAEHRLACEVDPGVWAEELAMICSIYPQVATDRRQLREWFRNCINTALVEGAQRARPW